MRMPFDLRYTMVALAWQESSFGVDVVSDAGACGVWQIMPSSFIKRYKDDFIEDGVEITEQVLGALLLNDIELNAAAALEEIKFWQAVYGKAEWDKIYASYNGGWAGNKLYAAQVREKVRAVMRNQHIFQQEKQ